MWAHVCLPVCLPASAPVLLAAVMFKTNSHAPMPKRDVDEASLNIKKRDAKELGRREPNTRAGVGIWWAA